MIVITNYKYIFIFTELFVLLVFRFIKNFKQKILIESSIFQKIVRKIAKALNVIGPFNMQLIAKNNELRVNFKVL